MTLTGAVPREHGTWAMVIVPWIVGCGIARGMTARGMLLLFAAIALFLAQHALTAWYRARRLPPARRASAPGIVVVAFTAVGLVAVAPTLTTLTAGLVGVFVVAAIALIVVSLVLIDMRLDHALPGQVLGAVGLPLTAPLAYFASGGSRARDAATLWVVDVAFFLWAVFYVRLKIIARAHRQPLAALGDRVRFGASTLGVTAALVAIALVALDAGDFSPRAIVAFAPALIQSIAGTIRLDHQPRLKPVGFLMLGHSIAFAVLFIALA